MRTAINGRRWASPFPPMNSADMHRFDDVMLAPAASPRRASSFYNNPAKIPIDKDEAYGIQLGDGSDAESEFEVDAGGGRVVFSRAPRGPWAGKVGGGATAARDIIDGGGAWPLQPQHKAPLLHQEVHTRPQALNQPSAQLQHSSRWQQPSLPTQPPLRVPSLPASPKPGTSQRPSSILGGHKSSSNGFSLSRLFRRRSVSRSRSSLSASPSASATPQSRASEPGGQVGNGKTLSTFAYTDSKMFTHSDNSTVNGGSLIGPASARSSSFNGNFTLFRSPQPEADYDYAEVSTRH